MQRNYFSTEKVNIGFGAAIIINDNARTIYEYSPAAFQSLNPEDIDKILQNCLEIEKNSLKNIVINFDPTLAQIKKILDILKHHVECIIDYKQDSLLAEAINQIETKDQLIDDFTAEVRAFLHKELCSEEIIEPDELITLTIKYIKTIHNNYVFASENADNFSSLDDAMSSTSSTLISSGSSSATSSPGLFKRRGASEDAPLLTVNAGINKKY